MISELKEDKFTRVYDVAKITPLEVAHKLSRLYDCKIFLKREDLQPVHSFKIRGAYNKMSQLSDEDRFRGVIAASAGNHAQGVALSAKKLGISALIVMPLTTPSIKIEAVKSYGAEVELAGDSYSDAAEYCKQRTIETGRTYIHPFDDPLVIAGQGTIGLELMEQLPEVTHIFVPVGGGGLISGIAQTVKSIKPSVKIISVEPEDSNVMQESIKAGRRVTLPSVGIFADGVAVKQLGENTFKIAQALVDDCITVNTDEICAAIKVIFEETRSIVEPAGALGVAGIASYSALNKLKDASAIAICSGANMTFERLQFISERTLLGSNKEILLAIDLPEHPGTLQRLCEKVVNGHNITQFCYRLASREKAHVVLGVSLNGINDKDKFLSTLNREGYTYTNLSDEDIAKEHVRYMIGGSSPNANNEHFYNMQFPERPGALNEFLKTIDNNWNISLFHYRGQGGDLGSVLLGFEAPNKELLEQTLVKSSYSFINVDNTKSIEIFNR